METLEYRTGSGFGPIASPMATMSCCGVNIPHDQSLEGHSDADVALHALTDALMGALAAWGYRGAFSNVRRWKQNRNSEDFLKYAANLTLNKERILLIST